MRLRDLEAKFLANPTTKGHDVVDDKMAGSSGIIVLCPACHAKNGGPVGTHSVICWWTGVPQEISPSPGRWNPSGTGLDDLTFVGPGAVSVALNPSTPPPKVGEPDVCRWHGHVRNGEATLT